VQGAIASPVPVSPTAGVSQYCRDATSSPRPGPMPSCPFSGSVRPQPVPRTTAMDLPDQIPLQGGARNLCRRVSTSPSISVDDVLRAARRSDRGRSFHKRAVRRSVCGFGEL